MTLLDVEHVETKLLEEDLIKELRNIEKIILPVNCEFSSEQRSVILAEKNANIIAGPGSGKTTVLIAKIALVIKRIKDSKKEKGICIITHTNVAVDEIKNQLRKIGISDLEYPNFIGTIHEFFNYFFAHKAYQELYPNKKGIVYDEDMYKKQFIEIFEEYKPLTYTYAPPTSRIKETYLEFYDKSEIDILGYCGDGYKDALIDTFKTMLEKGIFRHNDILSLSRWYIKKYEKQVKNAFANRFSWAFIDEAQDTSNIQYDLLKRIFNNESTILQKFGDPYQSLYTMFSNKKDAWIPSQEKEVDPIELSYSTRFGNSISNVLKTACIEEYTALKGNPNIKSFKPYLLLYKSKENVIEEFLNIVNSLSEKQVEFRDSNKKIGVVGLYHDEVKSYHKKYKKNSDVKPKTETIIKSFYELMIKGMLMYIKEHAPKEKAAYSSKYFYDVLRKPDYLSIKAHMAVYIKEVYLNKGIVSECIKEKIVEMYKEIVELEGIIFKRDDLLNRAINYVCDHTERIYISYQRNQEQSISEQIEQKEQEIYFGTVHAVKGETHKATLLLESEVPKGDYNNPELFYDCTEIFEFLIGEYWDYTKSDRKLYEVIRDGLKTAYVALSRPTHLAAVAINKQNFGKSLDEKKQLAMQAGWEVIELN